MQISYEPLSPSPREVAPGIYMDLPGTARFVELELDGSLYDVAMVLNMTSEGVRPTEVTVTAHESGVPITGTTLRSLRVWETARTALFLGVNRGQQRTLDSGHTEIKIMEGALSDEKVAALRRQGPTDESLEWVAYFYNLGGVIGLPPARQVEANLDLPRTTASKWIRRARAKGLLGPPKTGAPSEVSPPLTAEQREAAFSRIDRETGAVSDA